MVIVSSLNVLFLLMCPTQLCSYELLHLVDVQQVKCPAHFSLRSSVGFVDVVLRSSDLTAGGAGDLPHIITFLRSTSLRTDIVFQLMDGDGCIVNGGPHAISLESVEEGRNLRGAFGAMQSMGHANNAGVSSTYGVGESVLEQEVSAIALKEGQFDPRRLTSKSSADPDSPSARRRNANTISGGDRRRTIAAMAPGASSLTHGRFQTADGSGYGYTNLSTIEYMFGGRFPTPVKYGYTGSSAFGPNRPSAFAPVAPCLPEGAPLATGTFYMQSQFRQSNCSGFDCCFTCFDGTRPTCDVGMNRDLFRDDILESGIGFYPSDFVLPLTIRILSINGHGYSKIDICPSTKNATDAPSNGKSQVPNTLFLTVTTVDELGDLPVETAESQALLVQPTSTVLVALLFFICGR